MHTAVSTSALALLLIGSGVTHLAAQAPPAAAAAAVKKPKKPAKDPAAKHDARSDRLRGLSREELARLDPQLSAGPVALVEFADDAVDELPAINVAAIV